MIVGGAGDATAWLLWPGYTDLKLTQITPHIHAVHKLLSTWYTGRCMTRTTLLDSCGSNAHMITEIIRLARIEPAPTCMQHIPNSTRRSKAINPMTAQTRAPCTVRTAPVSHHSTFHLPFAPTEEHWTDPNIDENRPPANPPEFPLLQQVTGSKWRHSGARADVWPTNNTHHGVRTLVPRCTTAPIPKWRLIPYTHSSPFINVKRKCFE
jgi:hypothetical protein